jgi:hypothetical protein
METAQTYEKALKTLEMNELYDGKIDLCLVRKKYRMAALLYHPDKNTAKDAKEHFQEINEAYQYLCVYFSENGSDSSGRGGSSCDFDSGFQYKDVLLRFLRSVTENDNTMQSRIFYNIIRKITLVCEEKSLDLLITLNKELLIKIYDIIFKYSKLFRISEDFVLKMRGILEERMKEDQCVILHPTLEDLFAKNIYRLVIGDETLLIPLWHHELVYEINGADVYVRCVPILPEEYFIDSENNITIELEYNLEKLLDVNEIPVTIGDKQIFISVEQLRIVRHQVLVLDGAGIPQANIGDIYNITKNANIILDVRLYP